MNPNSKRSQKLGSAGSNTPGIGNQIIPAGNSSQRRKGGSQGKNYLTQA